MNYYIDCSKVDLHKEDLDAINEHKPVVKQIIKDLLTQTIEQEDYENSAILTDLLRSDNFK